MLFKVIYTLLWKKEKTVCTPIPLNKCDIVGIQISNAVSVLCGWQGVHVEKPALLIYMVYGILLLNHQWFERLLYHSDLGDLKTSHNEGHTKVMVISSISQ